MLLLGATLLSFITILDGYFLDDDFKFIHEARHRSLGEIFDPFHSGLLAYRPFNFAAFFLLEKMFSLEPLGYHLFNLALHLINTVLLYLLAGRLMPHRTAALAGSLLFGCSRLQNYILFVADNLGELLVLFFLLTAVLWHHKYLAEHGRKYFFLGLAAFMASLLTKENALVLPLVLFFLAVHHRRSSTGFSMKKHLKALSAYLAAAMAYGLYMLLMRKHYVSFLEEYDPGLRMAPNLLEYIASLASFSLWQQLPAALYPCIAAAMLLVFVLHSGPVRFLIAWTVLCALPYSPFVFNFHRALYVPSVGFYLLAGFLLHGLYLRCKPMAPRLIRAAGPAVLLLLAASNIYVSHQDIERYERRAGILKNIAGQVARLEPPILSNTLVLLTGAPDASWILEDLFRLVLDDDTISLVGFDQESLDGSIVSSLRNNASMRERIQGVKDRLLEFYILMDYTDGVLRVRERWPAPQ